MPVLCELISGTVHRLHPLPLGLSTLGRDATNSIVLSGPGVSRVHCRIVVASFTAVVEDLGARNGVYLDGRRVLGPVALHDGARLQVANYTFLCRLDRWPTAPEAGQSARLEQTGQRTAPARSGRSKTAAQPDRVRRARFHFWWFFSWSGFRFGWTIRRK